MLRTPKLTEDQVNQFVRDGFVVLPTAFNAFEAAAIQEWSFELSELPEEPGKHWVYHEPSLLSDNQELINRIENMTQFHKGFSELAECLKTSVGQLLGENAVLFKDKINFKMPGGDGFTPHQDSQAGWDNYAKFYLTAMVSVDKATIKNGCLEFASGHNQSGLIGELWKPLSDNDMKNMKFSPIETKPGDVVFFDCYTPHKSESNLTNKPRRILYLTYNKLTDGDYREKYYEDKYKNYPPDIDRDPKKKYTFKV